MGGSDGPGGAADDMLEMMVRFCLRVIVVLFVFFYVVGDHLHDNDLVGDSVMQEQLLDDWCTGCAGLRRKKLKSQLSDFALFFALNLA